MQNAWLTLDVQGKLIAYSQETKQLLGEHVATCVGKPVQHIWGESVPTADTWAPLWTSDQRTADPVSVRVPVQASPLSVDLHLTALYDGQAQLCGYVGLLAQASKPDTNPLQEELENAQHEADALRFAISHDLQSPLRAILGYGRILEEEVHAQLDAEGQRMLSIVLRNANRMQQRIETILHLSRLDRTQPVREPLDMNDLFNTSFQLLRAQQPPTRAIEWVIAPLPMAHGDREMVTTVIHQLLSNALKFSASRTPAIIQVGSEAHDQEIVYTVRDNGVGYDERYEQKLFQLFQRLHKERDFEGMGIGLALVETLVKKHRGRVWSESVLNEGATFFFTLPYETPANE